MRLRDGGAILSTFRLAESRCGRLSADLARGQIPTVISRIRADPISPVEGIKEVERLLDEAYTKACGKNHRVFGDVQVGSREYNRVWRSQGFSPTYGEITSTGVAYLFGAMLPPREEEHFVDLGSGMGRLCLQAWLQFGHQLASVTGVELSRVRHSRAVAASLELVKTESIRGRWMLESGPVNLVVGDMLRLPLHDKTFIYCANLTFSAEILQRLTRKILRESPIGTRVVSMRSLIDSAVVQPMECPLAPRGIPQPPPSPKLASRMPYDDECDDLPFMPAPPMPSGPEFDDDIDVHSDEPKVASRSFPRTRSRRRALGNPRLYLPRLGRRRADDPPDTDGKVLKLVDHLDLPMTWSSHTPLYVYEVTMDPL
ncbi:hypothetical protein FOZ61_010497 [Perkinsus olseni]|uniref:Histone-lysine N-methyltransferase, H3 lysine-79 specific n=1 Tax=Perkinsus olseni TaxID=32597 RepID=A0A7J6M2Z7_PEROL|nr:hypothetical protein FOZ61_010497 [Perkinsus olseni]KAF4668096.1 hypothetical protein FOL46_002161 [Perkinsus olseni]